ncbi:MAG TPA: M28 family peptidase [Gemmatimonadaceae bacterium]|nr:M28 family peptidase [Gemmatimonadaceae bacterium]
MVDAQLVARAKALIDDLSKTPRFAGSAEEGLARARCRAELESAGFTCREIPFDYSQWLGRWGPPFLSFALAIVLVALGQLTLTGTRFAGLFAIVAMNAVVRISSGPIRFGWILSFPWSRAASTNLEAKRGEPVLWLLAHLDTKSQTVPMLLRIFGAVALQLAGILVFGGTLAFLIWGRRMTPVIVAGQLLAAVGALGVGLCFVTNRSPGAVDNASGVAAVILAAQSERAASSLGVLITSGEELGLAGALAWTRTAPEHLVILNCDTVDELGSFRCMYTGAQPMRVAVAAENEANRLGLRLKIGRLIPGIMADSMVFADRARWSAITLSRGTLGTLARIHTRRDNSSVLTGNGAAQASVLLSALTKELS